MGNIWISINKYHFFLISLKFTSVIKVKIKTFYFEFYVVYKRNIYDIYRINGNRVS